VTLQAILSRKRYIKWMRKFAVILKELRDDKNLTQTELAIKLGFNSRTVIANWESGKRMPDVENLKLIARFFGVRIDYLVGLET